MPVTLRGVAHTYDGQHWVLWAIDLDLEPGTATAVVGPSGSGKSTLLAIAGGLLKPSRGEVRPAARDGRGSPRTAWILQSMNLLPRRSALENAALGHLSAGGSWPQALTVAREALARVGLDALADRPAYSLSGGEQQRLCIARALVAEPDLLLADEPTGQLDQRTSVEIARLLVDVRPSGTALLVATHDQTVASVCQRVLALVDGQLKRPP